MRQLTPQELHELDDEKKTTISVDSHAAALAQMEDDRKLKVSNRRRIAVLAVIAVLLLLLAFLLPTGIFRAGSDVSTFRTLFSRFVANVSRFANVFLNTASTGSYAGTVFGYTAAFVTGAVLGACGSVYQGAFRNPLSSPTTLGIVSGCLMGAVIFYMFWFDDSAQQALLEPTHISDVMQGYGTLGTLWYTYGRALCAVAGGFVVVGVALLVSKVMGSGSMNNVVLVVIGQVFTLTIGSVVDTVRYYFESTGDMYHSVLIQLAEESPFSGVNGFGNLALVCVPMIIGLVVLLFMRTRLNALSFTDDEARSMGVNTNRFRTGVVLLCTAVTGMSVAFCGPIGFVGFVAPHVARRIVGSNQKFLLPASLLVGAIFLVIALMFVKQIEIDGQYGVNLVTTALGCIVFLIVAFRNRGGAHAWK